MNVHKDTPIKTSDAVGFECTEEEKKRKEKCRSLARRDTPSRGAEHNNDNKRKGQSGKLLCVYLGASFLS